MSEQREEWAYLFPDDRGDMSQLCGGYSERTALSMQRTYSKANEPGQVFRRTVTYSDWEEVTS